MPGRESKSGKKKATLVCRGEEGARSASTCLHVDGVGAEDVKWSTIG